MKRTSIFIIFIASVMNISMINAQQGSESCIKAEWAEPIQCPGFWGGAWSCDMCR